MHGKTVKLEQIVFPQLLLITLYCVVQKSGAVEVVLRINYQEGHVA
jgi:hypothetical protein